MSVNVINKENFDEKVLAREIVKAHEEYEHYRQTEKEKEEKKNGGGKKAVIIIVIIEMKECLIKLNILKYKTKNQGLI